MDAVTAKFLDDTRKINDLNIMSSCAAYRDQYQFLQELREFIWNKRGSVKDDMLERALDFAVIGLSTVTIKLLETDPPCPGQP